MVLFSASDLLAAASPRLLCVLALLIPMHLGILPVRSYHSSCPLNMYHRLMPLGPELHCAVPESPRPHFSSAFFRDSLIGSESRGFFRVPQGPDTEVITRRHNSSVAFVF